MPILVCSILCSPVVPLGSVAADVAHGLALRMDHGSQYLSDHFLKLSPLLGHPVQLRFL